MSEKLSMSDRFRSVLVIVATVGTIAFNWLVNTGQVGGVTPKIVSDAYPTVLTPAGYAFAIWSLIYLGLIAFSIYQALPGKYAQYRSIRSVYIVTCVLNCAWLYFFLMDAIVICFMIIAALALTLIGLCYRFKNTESMQETLAAKNVFGLYGGWVVTATFVNLSLMLVYIEADISQSAWIWLGSGIILLAGAIAVAVRLYLNNFIFPLAVAWGLTAIAVEQSGKTLIVASAAVGVIACLIASASIVMTLKGTNFDE